MMGNELEARDVTVTQAHIDAGRRYMPWARPASLALNDVIIPGLFVYADIMEEELHFCTEEPAGCVKVVHACSMPIGDFRVLLRLFDTGKGILPFTFTLSLPARLWRAKSASEA